jgi:hypothetical protein
VNLFAISKVELKVEWDLLRALVLNSNDVVDIPVKYLVILGCLFSVQTISDQENNGQMGCRSEEDEVFSSFAISCLLF